jgi:hypothetical protein
MRSRQLESALREFMSEAADHLRAEVAAGAEVPFDLGARGPRRGRAETPLYCYRALTGEFIAEREAAIKRLPAHADAMRLLETFDGLDRYLLSVGVDAGRAGGRTRANVALRALMEQVFEEQTDFQLRPERLQAALARLEQADLATDSELVLVATLHGVAISSPELQLAKGLTIAQPDALRGIPEDALIDPEDDAPGGHLVVVHTTDDDDPRMATSRGADTLRDLLRALRLFGDGRIALGALAWRRIGTGSWQPLALGASPRPEGMLAVTAEQEDELRAFCNLVSRRAPQGNELAWALGRFELGCERASLLEAVSDHLLALRALLEPEGPSSGLLAGRVAALCATREGRAELTERITAAVALEQAVIKGTAPLNGASRGLANEVARHLQALLRDVICGHLSDDLAALADELLVREQELEEQEQDQQAESGQGEPEQAEAEKPSRPAASAAS